LITDCDTAAAGELMIPAFIEGLPVVAIGANAFADCNNLTGIQLPDSIREINESSFQNCSNLLGMELPEGLMRIPQNAFRGCQNLQSIHIPDGVKEIGNWAFYHCKTLESIHIPDGITALGQHTFYEAHALKEVSLPSTLKRLEWGVFEGCSALVSITIPASVDYIGGQCFFRCSDLVELYFGGNAPNYDSSLFQGVSGEAKAYINSGASGFGAFYSGLPVITLDGDPPSPVDGGDTGGETEPVLDPDAAGLYPIDVTGSAGAEIKVPFVVNNFQGISGIQTTITWDEAVMQLVMDGDNPKVTDSPEIMTGFPFILPNYFSVYSNNELTMVWDEIFDPEKGRSLDDESVLFALHFTLIGNDGETGVIRLSDDPTPFKLVPSSGEDIDETTRWAEITLNNEFTVSGNVTMVGDESSVPVSGVTVTLNQDGSDNDILTDASGDYSFTLTSGSGIKLSANLAHGEGKASQGVDVADIVEMRKHILARVQFENARKMVAADTNRDASVDVADIVAMRKVILARTDYFSKDGDGNKEAFWRFVDVEFVSLSADAAFDQVKSFEEIGFGSLSDDLTELDFAAIKLGDVNGDWAPPAASTLSVGQPSSEEALLALSPGDSSSAGWFAVDVESLGVEGLLGLQLGLEWDPEVLHLERIEPKGLPGFSQEYHANIQEGSAMLVWDDPTLAGVHSAEGAPLLSLHFSVQSEADRGSLITLAKPLLVEAEQKQSSSMLWTSYYSLQTGLQPYYDRSVPVIHVDGEMLSIEFATQEGRSYIIETNSKLRSDGWTRQQIISGSGRMQTIQSSPLNEAALFFRIIEVEGIVE
jgi:hypothetical protein